MERREEEVEVASREEAGRSYTGGRQEGGVTPSTSESASALHPGWTLLPSKLVRIGQEYIDR